ncbi:MAG: Coenzyme F420 hydrogenase/dehydrogenase, beta subunit C-terminal domain [Spirochaetota bacterium]|nr:Coenzyme F420 hydrogenase/dehydrogenase, beta subunit C-terminal domain [Spirochaetota bacterium]
MNTSLFQELKERAIDTQLCFFCGTCVAVCPADCIVFKDNGPELDGECTDCGQCLETCPGLGAPLQELDSLVFGRLKTEEEDQSGMGIFIKDRNLVSGDEEIFNCGYTGGKITAILAYLLDKKEIDAAIISSWGKTSPFNWLSWPMIAKSRDDLINGTGSKYVFSPNLIALKEILDMKDIDDVALVGLGCHIQGLRKLQYLGKTYSNLVKKVKYSFGLYCGAPMKQKDDFLLHVAKLCEVSEQDIIQVDFRRVSMEFDVVYEVVLKDGRKVSKQMNIFELFQILPQYQCWKRCRLCTDYSAEYADISFGGAHVTSRTPAGEDIVKRAIDDGWLITPQQNTNSMIDNMVEEIDRSMVMMKKVKNKKRIFDYRAKGNPTPEYD